MYWLEHLMNCFEKGKGSTSNVSKVLRTSGGPCSKFGGFSDTRLMCEQWHIFGRQTFVM